MIKEHFKYAFLLTFPMMLLVSGFVVAPFSEIIDGLMNIITASSVLLTDHLAVGGLGASLVNAGLCGLAAVIMIIVLKLDVNGPFIATVFTICGFAFFGKNIFNIWPVFIGVWLHAAYLKTRFRNYLIVALFGTTLAPMVSFLAFGSGLNPSISIPVAIFFGILSGFVLPPLASHTLRFHDGYNLCNTGFTGGLIGSFFVAILRGFDLEVKPVEIISTEYSDFFVVFLNVFFVILIITGFIVSKLVPGKYIDEEGDTVVNLSAFEALINIYKSSGRLVSDFVRIGSMPAVMINMGIMGIASSVFVILLGGSFNGPVIGGIITVVGFSAYGKHLRNCIPIFAGVFLASLIQVWETNATRVIMAGLFGATLAPIAGQYGILAGIAAGFFHLSIVMNVITLHGGINLYNNCFSGGFVAAFLVPLIDALKKRS